MRTAIPHRSRAQLLDGKKVAGDIYQELSTEVAGMVSEGRRAPHLVLVRVGHDPASTSYVKNKTRAADKIGEISRVILLYSIVLLFSLISGIILQFSTGIVSFCFCSLQCTYYY